jgi:hypothetical protein
MSHIKDFLSELQTISNEDTISIVVPSVYREVSFKTLTVKQYKDILKNTLDGVAGNIKLGSTLNSIITRNSLEPIEFTLYDRNYILTQLRKQSLGDTVRIRDNTYNLSDLPEFLFNFKFEKNISYKDIIVDLEIPTLALDTAVTDACYNTITKQYSDTSIINESISVILTYELSKFISAVSIHGNAIDLTGITINERKSIVDNLPLVINNKLIEHITEYRKYEQSFYKFNNDVDLSIDGNFLTSA